MLEIESVFKSYFQNRMFSGDYNWSNGTFGVPDNDSDVAIIREFLQGNIADIRLSARKANAVTSMVQTFEDAAIAIRDKLILMEQLAEKAAFSYYPTEKASTQNQLKVLAADINEIIDNTFYIDNSQGGKNKLFSAVGQTIERRIDKMRTIKLFPKNFVFDITSVDLSKDAQAALTIIKNAAKEAKEYTNYLNNQNKFLQSEMAIIDSRMASAAGLKSTDLETNIAQQITTSLATKISENNDISSQSQSNIAPDEALYLLKDE